MMAFWSWMTHVGLVIFILTDLLATVMAVVELRSNRKDARKHHETVLDILNGKEDKKEETS